MIRGVLYIVAGSALIYVSGAPWYFPAIGLVAYFAGLWLCGRFSANESDESGD